MNKKTCFAAYPSMPPALGYVIERAIDDINTGAVVDIIGWKSTSTSGRFIITALCEAINKADIFICDLTELNHNVLFELGYAIAKNKRIWILVDSSISQATENYRKFSTLTTIGYVPYTNSRHIVDAFYKDEPYENIESTIFKDAQAIFQEQKKNELLYLKSSIGTESSIKLSQRINSSIIPQIVDDPSEVPTQTLTWYTEQLHSCKGVIVHFLSSSHNGSKMHNAKNSFVSGLAYGFDKPLLMLAHDPFTPPIDYHDLLKIHRTSDECVSLADKWLKELETVYESRRKATKSYQQDIKAQKELRNISIGDPVAEHESDELDDYFIETSAYNEAINAYQSIFVGRKGSGKTANMLKIASEIKSDARNHVTIIKPVAYELEGVLRVLNLALHAGERGYLIESLWKFLIYTELAKSIYEEIEQIPNFSRDRNENELQEFIEKNKDIILHDFSIRLEKSINSLLQVDGNETAHEQRIKISELLHRDIINNLRRILGIVLEKKEQCVILIDNLDKAWNRGSDFALLSELILSLLRTTNDIERDFYKSSYKRKSVNLSMIIFLRSDIFAYILKNAREPDKIKYFRIAWQDPELLLRVIEKRFMVTTDATSPNDVWTRYFCPKVENLPTRIYITESVLPRPRDIIFLCKEAIAQAVNHGHKMVEENDILGAQKRYSKFALDSLLVENGISVEKLEELLYEFVGSTDIVHYDEIEKAMRKCNIPENKFSDVIDHLCKLTFLGVEVSKNKFDYMYDEEDERKLLVLSRKFLEKTSPAQRRFKINKPFQAYLEITS